MNLETKLDPRLWDAIRDTYQGRNFTGAILDAMYFLSDLLREKTDLESDGVALVGQAFGGNSPKLKVNALQSESDWSVQKGIEQLLRGVYQAIRNPRSHGKVEDTDEDSQAIILFINYIVKLVGQSKSPFSKTAFTSRVFDPDFVASERYAELLVSEIPVKKRLEVFFDVYRDKLNGTGESLRFFFGSLMKKLEDGERHSVYEHISKELTQTDDDSTIRMVIQAFEPSMWSNLDEAARLRTENKLIKSIESGKYLRSTDKCRFGSLGTWSTRLFPHFTLKTEALFSIRHKLLSSDPSEQDYVFKYLFMYVDSLADKPPTWFEKVLIEELTAGDSRFYEAITRAWLWEDSAWSSNLSNALKNFLAVESTAEPVEDDVPF